MIGDKVITFPHDAKGWLLSWLWHGQLIYHMVSEAACALIWKSDKSQKRELLGGQTATSNNLCEYSLLQAKCSFIYTEALDFSSNSTGPRGPLFSSDPDLLNSGKTCRIWHKRQKTSKYVTDREKSRVRRQGVGHSFTAMEYITCLTLWSLSFCSFCFEDESFLPEPFTPSWALCRAVLPPCPAPSPIVPTHRSSLSSQFCPWAKQRWCCLAARTGCPGSWPGRSENHCPPQSRCGSLPSPPWTWRWWACSWWICVRRDLWGKEAKAWPCLAELPSCNSKDQIKDPREPYHLMEMAREYLFQWKFIRVANSS